MRQNNKGFTLIELLVVIAIIGLLSTLAVIALNNARQKSRDAKRVSDIKQIQSALEMYYNDVNAYPDSTDKKINGNAWGGTSGIFHKNSTYMNLIPSNPKPRAPGNKEYEYTTDNQTYELIYELESGAGGLKAGLHTASEKGITASSTP